MNFVRSNNLNVDTIRLKSIRKFEFVVNYGKYLKSKNNLLTQYSDHDKLRIGEPDIFNPS